MRATAIIHHRVSTPRPAPRAAGRATAAVMLAAMLITTLTTSTDAHAGVDRTTSVEHDALAQVAMNALSQGLAGSGSWERRALLVGLGVAGLHAHLLCPEPSPGRGDRAFGETELALTWAPLVTIGPGSYIIGVIGRF